MNMHSVAKIAHFFFSLWNEAFWHRWQERDQIDVAMPKCANFGHVLVIDANKWPISATVVLGHFANLVYPQNHHDLLIYFKIFYIKNRPNKIIIPITSPGIQPSNDVPWFISTPKSLTKVSANRITAFRKKLRRVFKLMLTRLRPQLIKCRIPER